jgi:hypothetical protein
MSDSIFDAVKNYYVFKYVVDKVSGEPTEYEGEVQAFVQATDPWEAVEKAGFDDPNAYGANRIENLEEFEKAIADERKHLSKISKQLKEMTAERDAEREKFLKERPCPNGCGQMDEKFRCSNCGYGFEGEQLVEDLEKTIKDEKKKGNDTSELEAIRDTIKASLENEGESQDDN